MGNPKLKSLASLKRAIREGRKYASETENIKDPDEVSVPAEKTEQVMDQADYNIPTDGVQNTDNMGEARVLDEVTPLDSTLTAEDSDITAEKKAPVEETEQEVSLEKGASITNKIKESLARMKSKKVAKTVAQPENIAANISLSPDILSKVAKVMVSTEKGQQLALQALEEEKAEAVKMATLRELIQANADFDAQQNLTQKVASVHESSLNDLESYLGNADMFEVAKYAYAAGAQDAAMAAEQGELPPTEAAPAGDPAAEQDEIMQAISMLLQSGQIDEAGAQQLAEMAAQAAMADQNPELSDEELMMALEQAVQAGLITPEAIQQIMAGGAAPEAAAPVAPEAPAAEMPAEAGADAAAVPQEAPSDVAKTAAAIIGSTIMLKKAAVEEGIVAEKEADVTPEDVAAVLEAAVESGELSPEDAQAVEEEIVAAALENEGAVEDVAGDDAIYNTDGSDWDVDGEALAQALEEEGITPEEFGQALEELGVAGPDASVAEVEAEEEGLGDISEEELAAALAEEGVTEEELAQAIAEIEAEEAGVAEEADAGEEALELEGSEGDDPETEEVETDEEGEEKTAAFGSIARGLSNPKLMKRIVKQLGKNVKNRYTSTKSIASMKNVPFDPVKAKATMSPEAFRKIQLEAALGHGTPESMRVLGKDTKNVLNTKRLLKDLGIGGGIVAGADTLYDNILG